jgi:hypothetical protein
MSEPPPSSPWSTLLWVGIVAVLVLFLFTGVVVVLGADDY